MNTTPTQSIPNYQTPPENQNYFSLKSLAIKASRITPRIVLSAVAGYYILGYAYAHGWMAAIDKLAIKIMRDYNMGYVAIGAMMPTVQWYAAWALRITAASVALILYDLMERVMIYSQTVFAPSEHYTLLPFIQTNRERQV